MYASHPLETAEFSSSSEKYKTNMLSLGGWITFWKQRSISYELKYEVTILEVKPQGWDQASKISQKSSQDWWGEQ